MATTAKSVQARDPESVVTFYNNREVPAFSIRQGNQLIYSYEGESLDEGAAELEQFIEQFVIKSRSAAIYTLCVHTGLKGPISNKTEYNGSINFRMFDYADMYGVNQGGNSNHYPYPQTQAVPAALESKINGIALGLAELQKKMNTPSAKAEPESKLGMVGEIMDHPLGFAIGKALIERLIPGAKVPEPAGVINGTGTESLEESHKRLNDSLIILIETDPNIPLYLWKLAELAKTDRKKFDGFVNMVKMFF
jgi:hypothetical protein